MLIGGLGRKGLPISCNQVAMNNKQHNKISAWLKLFATENGLNPNQKQPELIRFYLDKKVINDAPVHKKALKLFLYKQVLLSEKPVPIGELTEKKKKKLLKRERYKERVRKRRAGERESAPKKDRPSWITQDYIDYINSEQWKLKRKQALRFHGAKCYTCGAKKLLQIHHLTYKNLFNEKMEDLRVLCMGCHSAVHSKKTTKTKIITEEGNIYYVKYEKAPS